MYRFTDFEIYVGARGRVLNSAGGASGGVLTSTSGWRRSSKIHPRSSKKGFALLLPYSYLGRNSLDNSYDCVAIIKRLFKGR